MYNNDDNYDGPIFNKPKEEESRNFFSQDQFLNTGSSNNNNYLSSDNNYSFNGDTSNMDVPPELDEIKNLSESNSISGPSLSALDPMNIMPNSIPESSSKLDLYDKGIIGNDNYGANEDYDSQENNDSYHSNNYNYTQEKDEEQEYANKDYDSQENKALYQSNDYHNTQENEVSYQPNNYDYDSYPIGNQNTDSNDTDLLKENNIFSPDTSYNVDVNNLPDLDQDTTDDTGIINHNYDISTSSDKILSLDEYINNNRDEEKETEKQENEEYSLGINQIPDLNSFIISPKPEEIIEEQKDDYDVVQDINLDNQKIDKIDDIDDIYNEPDSIEIMDIDTEKGKAIDQIKLLVNNLKNEGNNIEMEEFDFEDTYQFIIKIKKQKEIDDEDRNSL